MSTFDIGEVVTLDYTVKVDGVLTDPTAIALVVHAPNGTTSSVTPTSVTTGTYTANYVPLVAGTHRYRWTSTGAAQSAQDGSFDVRAAYSTIVGLSDVKDHLNITTTAHDDELAGFIDAASDIVEDIVGPVIPLTVTEWQDGPSGSFLIPRRWPVLSITSITEYRSGAAYPLTAVASPAAGVADSYTLDADPNGKITRRNGLLLGVWPAGSNTIELVYVVGRVSVPSAVRLATLELVRHLYQQTQQGGRPSLTGSDAYEDVAMSGAGYAIPNRVRELLQAQRKPPKVGAA